MFRIRMHGRGGQGTKTGARILGSALFAEGFEVQDAPRYGAERRGAPIFATVRAALTAIGERGAILQPDLVVVADETLVPIAAAGVLEGLEERGVLLLLSRTPAEEWRARLRLAAEILTLAEVAEASAEQRFAGAACAGAAARLVPGISRDSLARAVRTELAEADEASRTRSLETALSAWEAMAEHAGCVSEGPDPSPSGPRPEWIDLPLDEAGISAPDVHGALTSVQVRTGLWRTLRPVVDPELCRGCHWLCGSLCPDGAISPGRDGKAAIDYDHCKGCMICVAVCPPHAIAAIPETRASHEEAAP